MSNLPTSDFTSSWRRHSQACDVVKTIGDGVMKAEVQGDGLYSERLQKLNGWELVTASQEGHHEYFLWRRDGVS